MKKRQGRFPVAFISRGKEVTKRELLVFTGLWAYCDPTRRPFTVSRAKIAETMNMDLPGVSRGIAGLISKGWIVGEAKKADSLYLMRDRRAGFYKIGRSQTPKFRERTLQSDFPLINLVAQWSGRGPDERKLHKIFQNKRIRGEWFNLSREDVLLISQVFFS